MNYATKRHEMRLGIVAVVWILFITVMTFLFGAIGFLLSFLLPFEFFKWLHSTPLKVKNMPIRERL